MNSREPTCPRRLLQHLDTSHGLDGDGPEPVANVRGIAAEAGPSVDLSGSALGTPNHEAGSGRPVTTEARTHATLFPAAPILRRHRFARQEHVHPRPRPPGQDRPGEGP